MRCEDCAYFFRANDEDKYATCQFVALRGEPSWLDVPPCEEEDYYEESDEVKAMMYVDAWKNGDYDEEE